MIPVMLNKTQVLHVSFYCLRNKKYKVFKKWGSAKDRNVSEKSLLIYLFEKSEILKSSASLWCEYSMLKATLFIEDNTDISEYPK